MRCLFDRAAAALLAAAALALPAGRFAAADEPAVSDPTVTVTDVDVATLRKSPQAFVDVNVRFRALYHGRENLWAPFFTPFLPEDYAEFSVWPEDAEVWTREGRLGDLPTCLLANDHPQLAVLQSLARYAPIEVRGIVRSGFNDLPWLEVRSLRRLGPPRYSEEELRARAQGRPAPVPAAASGAAVPVWKLTPFNTGVCRLGKDHVLGGEFPATERLDFVIYSFLAEGPDGDVVLIDLGPKSLGYTNDMFRKYKFFRETDETGREHPDDVVQPAGNVFAQLARKGIGVERVSEIVFTHLHADHHGMDTAKNGGAAEDFPNARMCVSKTGWDYNVGRRKNGEWHSYLDWAFGDFLMRMKDQGRLDLIDDGPVRPGLEVRYLGGHSVCSRAVLVHTTAGWAAIASDDVYHYDLLEQGVMARLYTTPDNLIAATDRLAGIAEGRDPGIRPGAVLIPNHEPKTWEAVEAAGDGWLDALRPLSEKAVAGYRKARAENRLKILLRPDDPQAPGGHKN